MPATKTAPGRARPARPPSSLAFLRGFLENPKDVASIIPSSTYLQRRLGALECFRNADTVVELGPGTGETTSAILDAIPDRARLLCVELVPEFADRLRENPDVRLTVEQGDAADLSRFVEKNKLGAPSVVVSGVPFSHMSPQEGRRLVQNIHDVLAPGGTFVAYQFRSRICEYAEACFGSPRRTFVPWNIPPLDIYEWTRTDSGAAHEELTKWK